MKKSALSAYPCSILCAVFQKKKEKNRFIRKTKHPISADLLHPAFDIARSLNSFLDATATTAKSR